MSEHFIKNIEIRNFKCFEDFKAEGFGRVNLIGGKNNVGKTAFMEAVYINIYSINISTLCSAIFSIKFTRDNLEKLCKSCSLEDDIKDFENTKYYFSKTNINEIEYELINRDGRKEYKFIINRNETIINFNEFSFQFDSIRNILYIDNFGFTNNNLKDAYIEVQRMDKEDILNKYINEFDSSIEKFKIFDSSPECKLKDSPQYVKINEFGDGLKSYISIICSLYACEDGYLFIDEVDNGIHYTQLDKLWEIILSISKEQSVQIFATTHSKECIESYARVAKKLGDEDVTYSVLSKLKSGELLHSLYDYELLETAIKQEHEVR